MSNIEPSAIMLQVFPAVWIIQISIRRVRGLRYSGSALGARVHGLRHWKRSYDGRPTFG